MSTLTKQPTMADLLKKVTDADALTVGAKVSGTILQISKSEVLMDLPNIGLGLVRGRELYNDNYVSQLTVGQLVEAVVKNLENERGTIELSFRAVGRDKVWGDIVSSYESRMTIDAKIRDTNRGGFLVQVLGVYGFLPASLLSPAHAIKQTGDSNSLSNQMKKYIGSSFKVKIASIDSENDTVVVSEKSVWEEASAAKLRNYTIGQIVDATVTGVVDFGAFLRFDEDLEGLVHISEISWKKVEKTEDNLHVGQSVKAKIIDIDSENRINLSIKQTQENPWVVFSKNVEVGSEFSGIVSKITTFGILVTNDQDITAICNISQISKDQEVTPATIHEFVKLGEKITFTILAVEKEKLYVTLLSDLEEANKKLKIQRKKDDEVKKQLELDKIEKELKTAKSE